MNITLQTETINVVCIGDVCRIELSRLKKLLDKLEGCDGRLKTLAINDGTLEAALRELKVIKVTFRGGWYPGKHFTEFKTQIEEWIKNEKDS